MDRIEVARRADDDVVSADEFAAALRPHLDRLGRLIATQAPPMLTEDVTQDTLLRAFSSWRAFDRSRPLWPWLARIAKRACATAWDADTRWRRSGSANTTVAPSWDSAPGSDQHVAALHAQTVVVATLADLSYRERLLLYRCDVEEAPRQQVAQAVTLTPGAVRVALHRARQRFLESAVSRWATALVTGQFRVRLRARNGALSPAGTWAVSASVFVSLLVTAASHPVGHRQTVATEAKLLSSPAAVETEAPAAFLTNEAENVSTPHGTGTPTPVGEAHGDDAGRPRPPHQGLAPVVEPAALADIGSDGIRGGVRLEFTTADGTGHASANPEVRCRHSTVTKAVCTATGALPSNGPASFYGSGDGDS